MTNVVDRIQDITRSIEIARNTPSDTCVAILFPDRLICHPATKADLDLPGSPETEIYVTSEGSLLVSADCAREFTRGKKGCVENEVPLALSHKNKLERNKLRKQKLLAEDDQRFFYCIPPHLEQHFIGFVASCLSV